MNESVSRAIKVAFVVGIILNLINNPGIMLLRFKDVNIYKVLLTFIVPFCVSLYSSVQANKKK